MSIGYKIAKELFEDGFDYGGTEETIGFITDNYYQAMKIYRAIIKQVEITNKLRSDAHEKLQQLRENEQKWTRSGVFPKGFDKEEHAKLKEHLVNIREEEYDIIYNGKALPYDKLTHLIMTRMWLFKILYSIDTKIRKHFGPLVGNTASKVLWPMTAMMRMTAKHTKSKKARKLLKSHLKVINKFPGIIKERILNP